MESVNVFKMKYLPRLEEFPQYGNISDTKKILINSGSKSFVYARSVERTFTLVVLKCIRKCLGLVSWLHSG